MYACDLSHYFQDGAGNQAKATLMALQGHGEIEESYNEKTKDYDAKIYVDRWKNGREQGYIVMLEKDAHNSKSKSHKQINIAFFEHRNTDDIHAIVWEQATFLHPPTIDTAKFGNIYKDKSDTSFCVEFGEYQKMADFIFSELEKFWKKK